MNTLVGIGIKKKGKGKSAPTPPPPPPPPPRKEAKVSSASNKTSKLSSAKEKRDEDGQQLEAATRSVPRTINVEEKDVRDDISERSGLTTLSTGYGSSEASSKLPLPPPPLSGLKAVVRLQAHARGRRARRHYKILRWYHGLDESPSTKAPGNRSTVSASKDIGKAPKRMNEPKTAKPASSKEPSRPISSTTPPFPESSGAFRAPTEKSPPIMAPIEDFLDPEESEDAKKYAATAKKVLLLRTTDYVAYLNALLKAHAVEDILSESKASTASSTSYYASWP